MRLIGHLENEASARTLSDFLYVQGIDNLIEPEPSHGWALWIHSEDQMEKARAWLASYLKDPASTEFKQTAAQAEKLRERQEKTEVAYRKKIKDRKQVFRSFASRGFGPLTLILIGACIAVFFLEDMGDHPERVLYLFISEHMNQLTEVAHGQVWRLFTPIFVHYGFLHIFFNLLWIRDLGGMIETNQGTARLALLVFAIAGISNLAQFFLSGPGFGGMSGVVYGLVGYIWMRGKFDPGSGLFLHPTTLIMIIAWGALCLVGLIPNIANTVHVVGLGVGMAWGYLSSLRYR